MANLSTLNKELDKFRRINLLLKENEKIIEVDCNIF